MDPRGIVAFFPSDHHFTNNRAFVGYIETAFEQAKLQPGSVILLGIEPDAPEEAYGRIEPGAPLLGDATHTMFAVARFWGKPFRGIALLLMHAGCLWNSFVMAGAVSAFIDILQQTLPNLLACFEALWATAASAMKDQLLSGFYRGVPATNFSNMCCRRAPPGSPLCGAGDSAGPISVTPRGFCRVSRIGRVLVYFSACMLTCCPEFTAWLGIKAKPAKSF
jgi:hypothetical protein